MRDNEKTKQQVRELVYTFTELYFVYDNMIGLQNLITQGHFRNNCLDKTAVNAGALNFDNVSL